MAGLMSRASLIVKSKFSRLLNRAENPNETLDYSYEQMQTQLQNVKRGVADVVTAKKRLELQTQKLEQNVVKLETQARQALAANREDLARQALEGFRSTKEVLKAQYSAAEAQVKIGEAATGIGRGMQDTGMAIQRAKEKTEELQARASAIDELTSTGALEDFTAGDQTQLDRELAQLSTTGQVDQDMARLKAEVGAGDADKELGSGDEPKT
jgi:phage shock protein A